MKLIKKNTHLVQFANALILSKRATAKKKFKYLLYFNFFFIFQVREDKTPSQFKHLAYYILESHQTTFDANTDVLPKARTK